MSRTFDLCELGLRFRMNEWIVRLFLAFLLHHYRGWWSVHSECYALIIYKCMNPFTRYSLKTFRIGFISTMKSKGNIYINKTTVRSNKTHSLQQPTANTPHIHSISQFWALSNFSPFYLDAFIWLFVRFFCLCCVFSVCVFCFKLLRSVLWWIHCQRNC